MTGKLIKPELKSYWIGNENTELSPDPRFVNYFYHRSYCVNFKPIIYANVYHNNVFHNFILTEPKLT